MFYITINYMYWLLEMIMIMFVFLLVTIVIKPYMYLLQLRDTALHKASRYGNTEIVKALLDSGANVEPRNIVS